MTDLATMHCSRPDKNQPALDDSTVAGYMTQLNEDWSLNTQSTPHSLSRTCRFKNYYETIAFVNAMAWIANQENHHPDLEVGYNKCVITYTTHELDGLSINDFICAAKIDQL